MPLTEKGREILANMEKQYGETKGKSVFYASKNKGTISGVDSAKADAAHRRHAALDAIEAACDTFGDGVRDDSKFSEFVEKLEKKGYSKDYATKIAAKVGREKFGTEGMAKKAAAAR